MSQEDNSKRAKAKDYTVKRVDEDTFELWHEDTQLATLTKDEAWPVMIGRVHPEEVVQDNEEQEVGDHHES